MQCPFCGHICAEDAQTCPRCHSELRDTITSDDLTDLATVIEDTGVRTAPPPPPLPSSDEDAPDNPEGEAVSTADDNPFAEEEVTQPRRSTDVLICPGCSSHNPVTNDYCERCGAPLGVVTRVYKLDADSDQDRVDWLVYGIETSTTGRAREIEELHNHLNEVIASGALSLTFVTGPPGIGKSRVVREFNTTLDSDFPDAMLVTGKCRETDHLAYAPIARLVRKRFYIPELEIPRLARQGLLNAVTSIIGDEGATEVAHLVGYLIGLPFPESPFYGSLDDDEEPNQRVQERAQQALTRLFELDAQRNPLILVLEDANHAGEETLALLSKLCKQLTNSALLLVFITTETFLDEEAPHYFDPEAIRTRRVDVSPLSDEEVKALVGDILQRLEEVPDVLTQTICERALGNPLMVEEIVKILIGEEVIDTRTQPWELHLDKLEDVELPQELEGVLRARLDTLSSEEREALEVASVIGQTFWVGALLAMTRPHTTDPPTDWHLEATHTKLIDRLEALRRKDMIRLHPDSIFKGEAEFVFKHGVERDLIYDALDPERRKSLHTRCAQWYELHGRIDRFSRTMARHWEAGGNLTQAGYRYVLAGNQSRNRYLNRRAVECFELALQYLPEHDVLTRIEAFHNLGSTYELIAEIDKALETYQTLLQIAWKHNAKHKGGMALNKIGRIHRSLGQLNEAYSTFKQALAFFQQANDLRGIASTLDDIGRIFFIRGEYELTFKHYRAALELRRQLKDPRSTALSLHNLGSLKLSQGSFKDAIPYYRESLELRKKSGDRLGVCDTLNNLGIICMERGELQQALRLWEEALTIAQDIGYRIMEGVLLNNIGETALSMGAQRTAENSLKDAATIAQDYGDLRLLCDVQRNLGTLYLRTALYDDAVAALNASLSIARGMESKFLIGLAQKALGELYSQTLFGQPNSSDLAEKADACFQSAIQMLSEVGSEGELGRCLSSYGHFLIEQGNIVQGKQRLEMAKDIFSRLEMKRILRKTQQTIAEI